MCAHFENYVFYQAEFTLFFLAKYIDGYGSIQQIFVQLNCIFGALSSIFVNLRALGFVSCTLFRF